jgi:hypothetical protein
MNQKWFATALDQAQARQRTRGEARLDLLRARGASLTGIARELGKDLSTVSRVNRGERRSKLIEREIAHRLGLSASEAFPEWCRPLVDPHVSPVRHRRSGRVLGGRRMPDRAALITALILDRPMCLDCIVVQSGVRTRDLDGTLATVSDVLSLHLTGDRCQGCGTMTTVLSLDRPSR